MKRKWEKARFWLVICDFIEPLNSLYSPSYNSLLSEVSCYETNVYRPEKIPNVSWPNRRYLEARDRGSERARERESIGEANVASQDKRKIA